MAAPLDIGMPQMLDIGPGYTLRVTAIDATSGSVVPGATVGQTVITAALLAGSVDGLATGDWTPILIGVSA